MEELSKKIQHAHGVAVQPGQQEREVEHPELAHVREMQHIRHGAGRDACQLRGQGQGAFDGTGRLGPRGQRVRRSILARGHVAAGAD